MSITFFLLLFFLTGFDYFYFFGFYKFYTSIQFLLLDSSLVFQRQFHFYEWNPPVFSPCFPDVLTHSPFWQLVFFPWRFHFYCCIPSVFSKVNCIFFLWNPPGFSPVYSIFMIYDSAWDFHVDSIYITTFFPFFSIFMNSFHPFLWMHSVCVFHFYEFIPSVFSTSILFLWLDSDCCFPCWICFYDWIPPAFSTLISFFFSWLIPRFCLFTPPPPPHPSIKYLWLDTVSVF